MILLDNKADTFPCGLIGTPFEAVYKALRAVAADVWAVDPTVYRAGMAWGWYAQHRPEKLAGFRDVAAAALVSSFAPLVKDTQTDAELVEYLRQWRDYTPTFGRLQALYALFGATVDIQPITDPESQAVIPVSDTRLAFYVRITEIDFSRPLSLEDAREIALRATPLGSRPYVYYALESRVQLPVAAIPQAPEVFVENWEVATPAAPVLPTVTVSDKWLVLGAEAGATSGSNVIISANATRAGCWWDGGSGSYIAAVYDSSVVYAIVRAAKTPWAVVARAGLPVENVGGAIGVRNQTGASITVYQAEYAYCDNLSATVVPVYDANNAAYNAFKYTLNDTDYYYVLDGTQTDWTDDLAGVGYSLTLPGSIDIWFALRSSQSSTTFGANDYWGSFIIDINDKSILQDFGVTLTQVTVDGAVYDAISWSNSSFLFEPIGLYEEIRANPVNADMNNFRCAAGPAGSTIYYPQTCIWSTNAFNVACKTWKCRITKR